MNSPSDMDLSSLPKEKWWGEDYLCQVGDFWLLPQFIEPINRVINNFKPIPSDVILASFPKTGTTWLKSLLYSIVNRPSIHRLAMEHPHELVPFLEVQLYASSREPLTITSSSKPRRIFATHIPYQLMAKTFDSSECKVVYVTRNPKDTLISTWHFMNKWEKAKEEPWSLDEAAEKFCRGVVPCGPYYDHVMGYKKLSIERPNNVFFLTFEELIYDTKSHVKKLGEFLGCPFGDNEEEQVEEIVRNCSFEVLSNLEVNKSEESPSWFKLPYNSFFRKGKVGDHKNYLSAETIGRIDEITKEKFHSSGFMYGI
ncbi:hypothetical protein RD792_007471 [Penstemon davidsonii]|uniref:Sulfotransferase n=1 Tax=Penstemon davidsonii TaxID=160366 RepID=A0ABR0D7W1_9LAMI|nr:hypothetical protein RD792_007471 [Penstemon davidsonii]